jgi:hypothetical protein
MAAIISTVKPAVQPQHATSEISDCWAESAQPISNLTTTLLWPLQDLP